jgi:surface protein
MYEMFKYCSSLTRVPLFDTSKATSMYDMFNGCTSLTSVPLFDTSNATTIGGMFSGCVAVKRGALALYQQASTQATPPNGYNTFLNCGANTTTGAAELAQIPESWGGTAAG